MTPPPERVVPNPAAIVAALALCAQEAIHTPEAIQSYGALVVCDAITGLVVRFSENLPERLGLPHAHIAGRFLPELLDCPLRHVRHGAPLPPRMQERWSEKPSPRTA